MKNKTKKLERIKKQVVFNIIAIALFVILLNFNILVYPKSGLETRDTIFRPAWVGFSSYALIDNNPDFTSPVIVERGKEVELEPGTYYYCVPFFKTCMKKASFVVESEVSLVAKEVRKEEGNATYLIENTGNVETKVEVKSMISKIITGFFVLQPRDREMLETNQTIEVTGMQK